MTENVKKSGQYRVMSFLSAPLKPILGLALAMTSASWRAHASEHSYFNDVQGKWSGAGKIVAGLYKNTRFTCNLEGETLGRIGMKLPGRTVLAIH